MTPGGFVLHVLPALAYTVAVFVLGTAREAGAAASELITDKGVHILGFALLQALVLRAAVYLWPRGSRMVWLSIAGTLSMLVGILLEIVQAFVPYRSAEWLDLAADAIGVSLASAVFWALIVRWRPVSSMWTGNNKPTQGNEVTSRAP